MSTKNIIEGINIVSEFPQLVKAFEDDYCLNGPHGCGGTLLPLARAVAASVAKKVEDPQRKTAGRASTVSKSGINPTITKVRRGIQHDNALLDNTARLAATATHIEYSKDGKAVTVVDPAGEKELAQLINRTLSDGCDLVQAAAAALLEMGLDHANDGPGWLSVLFARRELDKRVVIRTEDSAKWHDVETCGIQEAFRATRREIENCQSVRSNPQGKYTYFEALAEDEETGSIATFYFRSGKYADLGGYPSTMDGGEDFGKANGTYTGSYEMFVATERLTAKLNLPIRQKEVLGLLLQGHGQRAIASKLGVTPQAVQKSVYKIRKKAEEIGLKRLEK